MGVAVVVIPNRYSACWGGTSPTAETALWEDYKSQKAPRRRGRAAAYLPAALPSGSYCFFTAIGILPTAEGWLWRELAVSTLKPPCPRSSCLSPGCV